MTETCIRVKRTFRGRQNPQSPLVSISNVVCNEDKSFDLGNLVKSSNQRYIVDVVTAQFFFVERKDIADREIINGGIFSESEITYFP